MVFRSQGTLFAVLSGSLLALGGVFWAIHAVRSDPEETRRALAGEVERLDRSADVLEKDRRMEELLAEPRYKEEARALWARLGREHEKVHVAAILEAEARREVPPFLRWIDVLKREPRELIAKAGEAMDELRALQSRYASSSYGDRLRAVEPLLDVPRGDAPPARLEEWLRALDKAHPKCR